MTRDHRHLDRELVLRPEVVVVEERDQRPPGGADAGVARGSRPGVVLAQVAHPGEAAGDVADRCVGRAIVYHDHLERPMALPRDAGERLVQMRPAAVGGNDHADERRGHAEVGRARASRAPSAVLTMASRDRPAASW